MVCCVTGRKGGGEKGVGLILDVKIGWEREQTMIMDCWHEEEVYETEIVAHLVSDHACFI